MDKQLKTKWLKALRSGRYKQTKGYLQRGDHYCCLGVLCKIQRADFSQMKMKSVAIGRFADGLSWEDRLELATRNDGANGHARHSFKQIADYIEKHL